MGLVDYDECRFCMEEPETAERLIYECVTYHYHRNLILGSSTINLGNFTEKSMDTNTIPKLYKIDRKI